MTFPAAELHLVVGGVSLSSRVLVVEHTALNLLSSLQHWQVVVPVSSFVVLVLPKAGRTFQEM